MQRGARRRAVSATTAATTVLAVMALMSAAVVVAHENDRDRDTTGSSSQHGRALALQQTEAETGAGAGSSWYDTATPDAFCGVAGPRLTALAFAQFERAWAHSSAFGSTTARACGGQTARQVFDKLKRAMHAATVRGGGGAQALFDAIARECSAHLTAPAAHYGLWSGGFHCSGVATRAGATVLEATALGGVLTRTFPYPTARAHARLQGAWSRCVGPLWNRLSVVFVSHMTGRCSVFFRFGGTDSVLYRHELPALQRRLHDGHVRDVVFQVVEPDPPGTTTCGAVRRGLTRVVSADRPEDLQTVLREVSAAANADRPGSVPLTRASVPTTTASASSTTSSNPRSRRRDRRPQQQRGAKTHPRTPPNTTASTTPRRQFQRQPKSGARVRRAQQHR